MKQIYRFKQLTEEAKTNAIEEVIAYEAKGGRDYEEDSSSFRELYTNKFKEIGLKVLDITFDISEGETPDYFDIEPEVEFFQKNLNEVEFSMYEKLNDMLVLYHRFLDDAYETEGYHMEYEENSMGIPENKTMQQFMFDYAQDEETKLKYKLPLLLETTLTEKQSETLFKEFGEFVQERVEQITEKLDTVVLTTNEEVEQMVLEKMETVNTVEFYTEAFHQEESHKEKRYCFNFVGELITDYDDFIRSEFKGVYNEFQEAATD